LLANEETALVIPAALCSLPVWPQIMGTNGTPVLLQLLSGVCSQL